MKLTNSVGLNGKKPGEWPNAFLILCSKLEVIIPASGTRVSSDLNFQAKDSEPKLHPQRDLLVGPKKTHA